MTDKKPKPEVQKVLDEFAQWYATLKNWRAYRWLNERDGGYCPQPEALEKLATLAYEQGKLDQSFLSADKNLGKNDEYYWERIATDALKKYKTKQEQRAFVAGMTVVLARLKSQLKEGAK